MDYRQIIAESWSYTQKNKRLILWYGFFQSILTTTVGVGYIAYQIFAFKTSWIFDNAEQSSLHQVVYFLWDFIKEHVSWTVPLVIAAIIFGILYFLYPTVAKASAIQMIARNKNHQQAGVGTGFRYGIMSFLPLFEYHMLITTFSFFSILIEMSFVVRNLGPVIFQFMLPVFIVFMVVSIMLTLLFTFSDFFIVIDDKPVFESMKASAKLVIAHWQSTFLITILMIIIGVRIVIQALIVFLIPAIVILVSGYIATIALQVTGVIVGFVIGFIALILASYLNGIVDIFSYSVWTFTFLELTSEKEVSARESVSVRDVAPAEESVDENLPMPTHDHEKMAQEQSHEDQQYGGHKNL
jgi:hypothetical protein